MLFSRIDCVLSHTDKILVSNPCKTNVHQVIPRRLPAPQVAGGRLHILCPSYPCRGRVVMAGSCSFVKHLLIHLKV